MIIETIWVLLLDDLVNERRGVDMRIHIGSQNATSKVQTGWQFGKSAVGQEFIELDEMIANEDKVIVATTPDTGRQNPAHT